MKFVVEMMMTWLVAGAFLIPYLIVVFFIGKPMYLLELAIGQFSSRGQVKVWKLSPIFKGENEKFSIFRRVWLW